MAPWNLKVHAAYVKVQNIRWKVQGHVSQRGQKESRMPDKTSLREAQGVLHKMRDTAPKDREEYLEDMADIYKLKGLHNRTAIIRNILRVEELRRTYGHIRFSIKTEDRGEITQIQYPTHQGWQVTTDPGDLEQRINIQQNKHFAQANSTPVTRHFYNKTDTHQELFNQFWNSQTPDTEMGLKTWFNRTNMEEISCKITPHDFQQGIRKWKESTSTSPSGRHWGTTMPSASLTWERNMVTGRECSCGYTAQSQT